MVDPEWAEQITRKLQDLEAGARLYEAHVENLMERVYELENTVETMVVRLHAVERATPLRAPKKEPPQAPRRSQ